MKAKIIALGIYGCVLFAVLLGCNNVQIGSGSESNMSDPEYGESVEIDFQLIGSQVIDTSVIRNWDNQFSFLVEEVPLTFFFQVTDIEILQKDTPVNFNLNLLDLEIAIEGYENSYFAITVGRELLEMCAKSPYLSFPFITFAEAYNPDMLYLYAMEPIVFWPSNMGRNSFYVMRGEERIYHGYTVNALNYSLQIQEIDDFMEGEINFQLLESHVVDTSGIRERFDILDWLDFTFFEQADTFADFVQRAYAEYNLDLSDITFNDDDYPDKYIVITIGRELSEIRYRFLGEQQQTTGVARANVTFLEENIEGVLYIYVMDRIPFGDAVVGGSAYYSFFTMRERLKVLQGESIASLNSRHEELMWELFARHFREVFDLMRLE